MGIHLQPTESGLDNLENDAAFAIVSKVVDIACDDRLSGADTVQALCDLLTGHKLIAVPKTRIVCGECGELSDPSLRVDGDNPFSAGDYCQSESCPGRYVKVEG